MPRFTEINQLTILHLLSASCHYVKTMIVVFNDELNIQGIL